MYCVSKLLGTADPDADNSDGQAASRRKFEFGEANMLNRLGGREPTALAPGVQNTRQTSECKRSSIVAAETWCDSMKVLYGLPILLSAIPRLAAIARILGEGTIGVFADHPDHIRALEQVDSASWPGQVPVWVNIGKFECSKNRDKASV